MLGYVMLATIPIMFTAFVATMVGWKEAIITVTFCIFLTAFVVWWMNTAVTLINQ